MLGGFLSQGEGSFPEGALLSTEEMASLIPGLPAIATGQCGVVVRTEQETQIWRRIPHSFYLSFLKKLI